MNFRSSSRKTSKAILSALDHAFFFFRFTFLLPPDVYNIIHLDYYVNTNQVKKIEKYENLSNFMLY